MSRYVRFPLLAMAGAILAAAVLLSSAGAHTGAGPAGGAPAAFQQSKITFNFVRNGQPVEVTNWMVVSSVYADGVSCPMPQPGSQVTASGRVELWPRTDPGVPPECSKGPPTTLKFEFTFAFFGDFITAPVEFVWAGGDMTVDLEIPPALDLDATPSPTPFPQWAIVIDLVRDGEPVAIEVIADRPRIYVNGIDCTEGPVTTGLPGLTSGGIFFWPPFPGNADPACFEGPPTPLEFRFLQTGGVVVVGVEWLGGETSVDFEVPASVEVFPAPAAPGEIPATGGEPAQDRAPWPLLPLGLGLIAFLTGAWLLRRVLQS